MELQLSWKTDKAFEELRAEMGAPQFQRIAAGVLGIVANLAYLIWGVEEWPTFAVVAVLITAAPAWVLMMRATLQLTIKKGLFFGYKQPILNFRWIWWAMIWPAPDEPQWRKTFATVVLACVVTFAALGEVVR